MRPLATPFRLLLAALLALQPGCGGDANEHDPYRFVGPVHFASGVPARNPDGTINVVVEIPAGTTAKWEVDATDGSMRWEIEDGAPRVVRYLPYPGNYGMVPRTLLPVDEGGDGDPLDVILLGPAVDRGSVVRAHVIGVLELLGGGERDDKLLAVADGDAMGAVRSLEELERSFPGVATIVETWFTHYAGVGEVESRGYAGPREAERVLAAAEQAWARAMPAGRPADG